MKKLLAFLAIMFFAAAAAAADVTLIWEANSEANIAGYKLHWGTVNKIPFTDKTDVGNATQHTITDLAEDTTYYFAVSAYDTEGGHSVYSNIVEYIVRPDRIIIRVIDRPKNIKVIWKE